MRKTVLIILFLAHNVAVAQLQLTGKVIDAARQALPYANVLLLSASDSSLIKGTISDGEGKFMLHNITPQAYVLSLRMVGFQSQFIKLDVKNSMILEPIVLEEENTLLNEVVVRGNKPFLEQQIDKLIVNVENSVVSAGGTVLDVLERSPGISVNRQSGAISMNGKQDVQIMINGKLQRVPLNMVIQQLEGLTSSNVSKIELVTNPSARYDAEGHAGIINIITKKDTSLGTNGTATAGLGYSDYSGYFKPMGSFNISHKRNRFLVYTSYSINNDRRWQQWNYERQVIYPDLYSHTQSDRYVRWPIQRASIGAEWNLTEKTALNTFISGFSNLWKMESHNHSYITQNDVDSASIKLYDREVNHWKHLMGNLNLNHHFGNGGILNADIDYLYYHDHNPNNFINNYSFFQSGTTLKEEVRTGKETPIRMGVFKFDYERKFNTLKVELGIKSSFSRLRNHVKLESKVGDSWVANPQFSQDYLLKDDINAVYASASGSLGKRGQFQLGLRAESTDMQMSASEENIFDLKFWKLFPTAFYVWKIDDKSAWQFSYGKRITRPAYTSVAPFVIFMDPFTYYWGNLELKPAISNALQATYSYLDWQFSFKYSHDQNAIAGNQSRYNEEDQKTYIYADNVDLLQLYSLTASFPIIISDWWKIQNNALFTYQKTDHVYKNTPLVLKQYSVRLSAHQNFTLPYGFTIELTSIYSAPRRIGLSKFKAAADISAGVQKKIGEHSKINLSITDIFWTRNSIYLTDNPILGQIQQTSYYNEPRVLRLSYTFNFGNNKMKTEKQRATASDAEQQRVN